MSQEVLIWIRDRLINTWNGCENMTVGFTLSDVRSEIQSNSLKPKLGLFLDKLSLGDGKLSVVSIKEDNGYLFAQIKSNSTEQVRGLDFYESRFGSFEKVVNCDFIQLLSICSKVENYNRDARVSFYNRDTRVHIHSRPLATSSYSKNFNEEEHKIGFLIPLDRKIIDACKIIRRHAESYDGLKYILEHESEEIVFE